MLHWKKLANPIVASPPANMVVTGFRDPCLWRECDAWYMGIGSGERVKGGCVLALSFTRSAPLEYLHKLAEGKPNGKVAANPCDSGEMWECPDFFDLNGHIACLLHRRQSHLDNRRLRCEGTSLHAEGQGILDHGAYYAPKSFLAPDGRRILWGWIRETRPENEFAAAGWSGAMALPRVLTVGSRVSFRSILPLKWKSCAERSEPSP